MNEQLCALILKVLGALDGREVEHAQPLGDIMVWVENGYLATLEYAWVTDHQPSDLPLTRSLELRANPESLDAWSGTHEDA